MINEQTNKESNNSAKVDADSEHTTVKQQYINIAIR